MINKRCLIRAGICGLSAAVLIALLRCVDVAPVGPAGTRVGLSHLNSSFFRLFGVNMLWYDITDWLGFAAVLTAFLFAAAGLSQLIRRKSILKVDREILALGGLYLLAIGLYLLFERVIVNCRPIIMPGCERPEASFPSSHTMLACTIMGSAMLVMDAYIGRIWLRRLLRASCALVIGVTVVGRLVSGVHWLTDIAGGLLISAALLSLFAGIIGKGQ